MSAKNQHAVALGRLGGLRGGKARSAVLSPERRQEIAGLAGRARWAKSRQVLTAKNESSPASAQPVASRTRRRCPC